MLPLLTAIALRKSERRFGYGRCLLSEQFLHPARFSEQSIMNRAPDPVADCTTYAKAAMVVGAARNRDGKHGALLSIYANRG